MKKCNRILSVMAVVVPSVASVHRQTRGPPLARGRLSPLGGRAGLKPTCKRAAPAGAGAVCAKVLICCNNAG